MNLSYEEVLSLLKQPSKDNDGAFTAQEFAAATSTSKGHANQVLRRLIDAGLVEFAGNRPKPRVDGQMLQFPHYRLIKQNATSPKSNRAKARKT